MVTCAFVLLIGATLVHNSLQILRGRDAAPEEAPYHAAIYHQRARVTQYACGGTVLSDHFLLTAGHCVRNDRGTAMAAKLVLVKLGITDLEAPDHRRMQIHNVQRVHLNADRTVRSDIALLELRTSVQFSAFIQPASIDAAEDLSGQLGTIAGWGITESDETSSVLKVVQLPVVTDEQCIASDRDVFEALLDRGSFCAGFLNGTGICNGDAGGGLMFERDGKWYVGGIASFSAMRDDALGLCGTAAYAGFTKVSHFLPWIRLITGLEI